VTVQVVSGGELRAVDQALPPVPYGGGMATLQVPFLPHVLAGRFERNHRLLDAEWVYRTQPAVRKVVDFLVARFKRVPLKGYLRVSDTERQPLPDGDLASVLRQPWANTPQSRFLGELFRDRLLWDRWAVMPVQLPTGEMRLRRLRPQYWQPVIDGFGEVVSIWFGTGLRIPREELILWYGRDGGINSPMEAVFSTLQEMIEGARYREQTFRNGGRFQVYAKRPVEAPQLSDGAYKRFTENAAEQFTGDGPQAGGIPLLEEGTELAELRAFSPVDQQYLEGVTLGEIQTCSFFHLAPELLGARPGNYSNMDAFRQGLYAETLGPDYVTIQDEFNVQLVPTIESDERAYVEFMLEAVLSGSFLEQAETLSRATGGPWLLRSEARAMVNRPPVEGMDEPIVPLNVVVGGLANPRDTGRVPAGPAGGGKDAQVVLVPASVAAQLTGGVKAGGAVRPPMVDKVKDHLAADLADFFRRQGGDVLGQLRESKSIAPAIDWQKERWDAELAATLLRWTPLIASSAAHGVLERFDPAYDWSDEPMAYWLKAAATGTAGRTNTNTYERLMAAATDPDWQTKTEQIFSVDSTGSRADALALSVATEVRSFGGMEAAKAVGARQKRWVVHSDNPRLTHAAINGETVGIHETFSIGGRYPGDHNLSPDERAGCTCALEYLQ
jgi:HK97 family phage portal protein